MKLPVPLSFDWDQGNVDKNWLNHQVDYKETEEVFLNYPVKIFLDIKHSKAEKRFQALGITDNDRYLTVFFTVRDHKIRVISARDQTRKEKRKYGQK